MICKQSLHPISQRLNEQVSQQQKQQTEQRVSRDSGDQFLAQPETPRNLTFRYETLSTSEPIRFSPQRPQSNPPSGALAPERLSLQSVLLTLSMYCCRPPTHPRRESKPLSHLSLTRSFSLSVSAHVSSFLDYLPIFTNLTIWALLGTTLNVARSNNNLFVVIGKSLVLRALTSILRLCIGPKRSNVTLSLYYFSGYFKITPSQRPARLIC